MHNKYINPNNQIHINLQLVLKRVNKQVLYILHKIIKIINKIKVKIKVNKLVIALEVDENKDQILLHL